MKQIAIFIAVGSAAAFTHLAVVVFLVELLGISPLGANVIGFCVAFLVSATGHARYTFPISPDRYGVAKKRFFAIAGTGFVLNQIAYAEVLHLFGPRFYLPMLAAVLLAVAVATFLLSKLWAFAEPQA